MTVRCVGYGKTKKERCRREFVKKDGRWLESATMRDSGPVSDPPRCFDHPQETDPAGWTIPQDWRAGVAVDPPEAEPVEVKKDTSTAAPEVSAAPIQELEPDPEPAAESLPPLDLDFPTDSGPAGEAAGVEAPEEPDDLADVLRDLGVDDDELEEPEGRDVSPGMLRPVEGTFTESEVAEYVEALTEEFAENRYGKKLSRPKVQTLARGYTKLLNHATRNLDPNNPYGAAVVATLIVFGPLELQRMADRKEAEPDPEPEPAAVQTGPVPEEGEWLE